MNMLSKMSPFAALLKDFMVEIDKTQIVGWSFLYKGKEIIIAIVSNIGLKPILEAIKTVSRVKL